MPRLWSWRAACYPAPRTRCTASWRHLGRCATAAWFACCSARTAYPRCRATTRSCRGTHPRAWSVKFGCGGGERVRESRGIKLLSPYREGHRKKHISQKIQVSNKNLWKVPKNRTQSRVVVSRVGGATTRASTLCAVVCTGIVLVCLELRNLKLTVAVFVTHARAYVDFPTSARVALATLVARWPSVVTLSSTDRKQRREGEFVSVGKSVGLRAGTRLWWSNAGPNCGSNRTTCFCTTQIKYVGRESGSRPVVQRIRTWRPQPTKGRCSIFDSQRALFANC